MRELSNSTTTGDQATFLFGNFRLDLDKSSLWHGDELVPLTPKALETLAVLIRHGGNVVTKETLLDEVWAGTFVEESTLSQNILTLRKSLGSYDSSVKYIETVPRRGYRWAAEVRSEPEDGRAPESDSGRDRRRFAAIGLGFVLLAVIAAVSIGYLLRKSRFDRAFRNVVVTNVYSDSAVETVAVSPNGKYLALATHSGNTRSIILRHADQANSLEIVPTVRGRLIGMEFSALGDNLYFSVYPPDSRRGELFRVPAIGGATQTLLSDIDSAPAASKDGRMIAFIRNEDEGPASTLVVADADGGNQQVISRRPSAAGFEHTAISSDGRFLAGVVRAPDSGSMSIVVIDRNSGEEKMLDLKAFRWIGPIAWLEDGSGVAFIAYPSDSPNLTDEVWIADINGGARMIGNGVSGTFGLSLTADSTSIFSVRANKITSIVSFRIGENVNPSVLITKSGDESLLPLGTSWTTADRIVFSTTQNGNADLWEMNTNGSERRQLTSDPSAEFAPVVSGDDILYISNRDGRGEIRRMSRDGTQKSKIEVGSEVASITKSTDSDLLFTAYDGSIFRQKLWRVPVTGGTPRRLSDRLVFSPQLSPDGRIVACFSPAVEGRRRLVLTLLDADSGEVVKTHETPVSAQLPLFDWFPDGESLAIAAGDANGSAVYRLDLRSAATERLRDWPQESIFRIAVAPDGKTVLIEKGTMVNEIIRMTDQDN